MPTVSDPDLGVDDWRSEDVRKLDLMVDQVGDLARSVKELVERVPPAVSAAPQTQTVIHKTQGMGAWGAAGVVACFFTYLTLIVLAIIFVPTIHDLLAWQDILRKDVARLQAERAK